MLYYMFCRSRLIPPWLSGWGIIGVASTMSASLLLMFRRIDVRTPAYVILNLPLALQETVLAVWLIARGFPASSDERI
jgi:hypothetical protein